MPQEDLAKFVKCFFGDMLAISEFFLRLAPYFPGKIHLYHWHPNLFLSPLCTKKINNDYPVPGWFSETISVDMPQQCLAKFAL
jgi:hypothetical protein